MNRFTNPAMSVQGINFRGKRGPDDVGYDNGNGMDTPMDSGMEMETKKVRLDMQESAPSKVVHIRNLPPDANEAEITALGTPFGVMNNMVLAKKKNQALLEFKLEEMAIKMVNYYKQVAANLRGRNIIIQFSNYQELKTDQQNTAADNALKSANMNAETVDRGSVLKVIVERMMYPVTVDILHQLFERYGVVEKIVTFTRNGQFHALIQMSNSIEAQNAKLYLDCQNIYTGCNTLLIEFSKNASLNVKYNNDKSRDYTIQSTEHNAQESSDGHTDRQWYPPSLTSLQPASAITSGNFGMLPMPGGGGGGGGVSGGGRIPSRISGLLDQEAEEHTHCTHTLFPSHHMSQPPSLMDQFSSRRDVGGHNHLMSGDVRNMRDQHGDNHSRSSLLGDVAPMGRRGMSSAPGMPYGMGGFLMTPAGGMSNLNCVVLVSNLEEEKVTPDALFTLFGVYGDVQRVKIIFAKKENALIQFVDGQQAQQAIQHLSGVKLYGKPLKIVFSKHNQVQMPKDVADAGLTKDYSNSPLHRFKKPNSKNFQNIFSPSAVLHLSNIPPDYTEDSLRDIFDDAGFNVVAFKFFQKDKKMALLQLPTVDEAVLALIQMHNYQMNENFHLRVSFSKSTI